MKMQKLRVPTALVVAIVATAGGAAQSAQGAKAGSVEETIQTRQQGLKALGAAFKTVRDELRTDSPDVAKIRSASADITHYAGEFKKWFPPGSGPESGVKTDAKPEAWTDAKGFADATGTLLREADKWGQLGDAPPAALKEAATSLGQACKGCHDKYRVKRE
jgi:cytochrome c556